MELSFLAFTGLFLTGLALNLTPCVYPMLSVTVAVFSGRQEKKVGHAFIRSLIYFFGITVMYSSLGAVAALSGGFFGAALQSPVVLVVIAMTMFVLALSMLGFYEFQMPSVLVNWAGGKQRKGYFGVFMSGLLVGIFAAPCIGPPIVALLALVGQLGNAVEGFLMFFMLSVGLGFPYLLLGTFSGLLDKLPRSGDWLVWIKKLFGVALLGLALFYFSFGLYVDLLPFVVPVTVMGGAIYLGFMDRSGDKNRMFKRLKRVAGALALVAVVAGYLTRPRAHVQWEMYTPEKITAAIANGKPVVVDVYADWCIPCHELERFTYSNQQVIDALEPFLRIKVDATNPATEEAMEPLERFSVVGVPTILFLDPSGKEVEQARVIGYVPPGIFLQSVALVWPNEES
jgi:thioredoxin:protein disulfide reductase